MLLGRKTTTNKQTSFCWFSIYLPLSTYSLPFASFPYLCLSLCSAFRWFSISLPLSLLTPCLSLVFHLTASLYLLPAFCWFSISLPLSTYSLPFAGFPYLWLSLLTPCLSLVFHISASLYILPFAGFPSHCLTYSLPFAGFPYLCLYFLPAFCWFSISLYFLSAFWMFLHISVHLYFVSAFCWFSHISDFLLSPCLSLVFHISDSLYLLSSCFSTSLSHVFLSLTPSISVSPDKSPLRTSESRDSICLHVLPTLNPQPRSDCYLTVSFHFIQGQLTALIAHSRTAFTPVVLFLALFINAITHLCCFEMPRLHEEWSAQSVHVCLTPLNRYAFPWVLCVLFPYIPALCLPVM